MEDYRKKYADYYEIVIGKGLEVHHVDGDRRNNDMDNLILIPAELHHRLHIGNGHIIAMQDSAERIATRAYKMACLYGGLSYDMMIWEEYAQTMKDMAKWGLLKYLEYRKPSGEKLSEINLDAICKILGA